MQNKDKTINGYIEGYYGRLLNWEERNRILLKLKENKMNFYFYGPKEDEKHRFYWKKSYDEVWLKNFKMFCEKAKLNKIKVIVGLAPGLTFNFLEFKSKSLKGKISQDLQFLINKISIFRKFGATDFALLFDDLPNNFYEVNGKDISEGQIHAELTNTLALHFNKPFYVVPRIYANQLIIEDKKYLIDFGNSINKENITFYSGKNIVSKIINKQSLKKVSETNKSKIVIWDNFYANDYCPRRLILGPLLNRFDIDDLMMNLTGLIETDLLIIDIVAATKQIKNPMNIWKNVLKKHSVPIYFFNICTYFLKPDFGDKPKLKKIIHTEKNIECLENLLWKWKTPLSREWYPYLLGLKHDLQLFKKDLTSERIIKINTLPLSNFIFKN
jgi:hyaluronoglucosaminidase